MPSERTGDPPKRPSLAAAAAAAIAAVCFGVYSCPPASLLRVFAEPSCSDAGPWPCEEEGCPSPSLGCADLAELGVCRKAFSDIYTTPTADAAGRTAESNQGQRGQASDMARPAGRTSCGCPNRGAAWGMLWRRESLRLPRYLRRRCHRGVALPSRVWPLPAARGTREAGRRHGDDAGRGGGSRAAAGARPRGRTRLGAAGRHEQHS